LMMGVATYACIDKTHPSFELLRYVCMYVCMYIRMPIKLHSMSK